MGVWVKEQADNAGARALSDVPFIGPARPLVGPLRRSSLSRSGVRAP
jgi:hypothetical protein